MTDQASEKNHLQVTIEHTPSVESRCELFLAFAKRVLTEKILKMLQQTLLQGMTGCDLSVDCPPAPCVGYMDDLFKRI